MRGYSYRYNFTDKNTLVLRPTLVTYSKAYLPSLVVMAVLGVILTVASKKSQKEFESLVRELDD